MNIAIGALLHDVVEDNKDCTCEMICKEFGERVSQIVYRLTRIRDGVKLSVRQIVDEAMSLNDEQAIIIKVCDRWHNMLTIEHMSFQKQKEIAEETLAYINIASLYIDKRKTSILITKLCYQCLGINPYKTSWINSLDDTSHLLFLSH